jgi:penicillin amidase
VSGAARGKRKEEFKLGRHGAVLLVVLIAVAAGWLVRNLREGSASQAAFPIEEGRVAVAGLSAPLEIYRDDLGVPHIQATSESEAYFGWGFAHAQDRLAQMLWLRMSARGRAAESIGSDGLEADRWARTLGFGALADREFERLDSRLKELLVAYAAGVNARLERIRAGRAAPPVALQGAPLPADPWRPADSLAILKLYSWGLADTVDVSLVLRDISAALGGRRAQPFFPSAGDNPVSPDRGVVTARRNPELRVPQASSGLRRLRRAVGLDGRAVGSSAWVLGGHYTESGHPILAADSHLEPTIPSLLHVSHVSGGNFDVAGAAVPGIPVFWTGYNRRVAWASTHARAATIDLYKETLGESDSGKFHDGERWRPLAERVEPIGIRGRGEELLTVRSTGHGPLIHELIDAGTESLSLAWVGALADINSSVTSMSQLARAADVGEMVEALAQHHDPPLTVAYADRQGAGGVKVAAWIPLRALPTDLVPLPGRARWYDWKGHVPFEELPGRELRGGRGWVIAADNQLTGVGRAPQIDWLWRPGARAERIDALLSAGVDAGKIDLRGMSLLQADVGSQAAASLISVALEAAGPVEMLSVEAQEIARHLIEWDGNSTPDSVGAAAYHVFVESLGGAMFSLFLGEELADRYRALAQVDVVQVVLALFRTPEGDALDSAIDAERIREIVRESLRQAWLQLSFRLGANREKWRWGRLHHLTFRPFGFPRAGTDLAEVSELPYGGSGNTINTGEFIGPESLAVRVASTFRLVVDLGSTNQALIGMAPGESEHPHHPHFRDGVDDWLSGHSSLLVTDRLLVRESGAQKLVLEPLP